MLEYNAMQMGIFELLQAKQAEIDAGRDYVESLRDYWTARADLEKAVGGRLTNAAVTTRPTTQPTIPAGQPQESSPQPQHQQGK